MTANNGKIKLKVFGVIRPKHLKFWGKKCNNTYAITTNTWTSQLAQW